MFFLLRMTFWLGLVCVLLPGSGSDAPAAKIDPASAVTAAGAAVSDMRGFCERQPQACEVGGQAATVIGQRAADGARKVYSIITDKVEKADQPEKVEQPEKTQKVDKKAPGAAKPDKKAPDHTGSIGDMADAEQVMNLEAPRDTLTADDLAVEWRVPAN